MRELEYPPERIAPTAEELEHQRENSARWDAASAHARETGRFVLHEPSTIFSPSGESFGMVFTYKPEFAHAARELVRLANAALDRETPP
jgi:hypothetical protein